MDDIDKENHGDPPRFADPPDFDDNNEHNEGGRVTFADLYTSNPQLEDPLPAKGILGYKINPLKSTID